MKQPQQTLEQALESAVSRALRDNLVPLQRTAEELHQAYADLVAACSSTRPSNALPALLRAQTAASALAAGLSVLSNFVAVALKPRAGRDADESARSAAAVAEPEPEEAPSPEDEFEWAEEEAAPAAKAPGRAASATKVPIVAESEPEVESAAFDVASLPTDVQDLHRRANRVAKVAMQDIKLLRPKDVSLGRQNKDICVRLRADLDKARKEYDRRFRTIQEHPVDYFHHWMVEILGEGNPEALGEYPYPSPALRH